MKIGYARVSTRDQNLDLQVDALKSAGCERIYQDVAGGAKTARPALDDMLGQLRAGDVLVIWKLDRMGRSLTHLNSSSPHESQLLSIHSVSSARESWSGVSLVQFSCNTLRFPLHLPNVLTSSLPFGQSLLPSHTCSRETQWWK